MVSACLNLEFHLIIKYKLSGWWFQTFFIFHFIYGMSSFPLTFICFRGVGIPPTSYVWWMMGHNSFLFSDHTVGTFVAGLPESTAMVQKWNFRSVTHGKSWIIAL